MTYVSNTLQLKLLQTELDESVQEICFFGVISDGTRFVLRQTSIFYLICGQLVCFILVWRHRGESDYTVSFTPCSCMFLHTVERRNHNKSG